MKVETEFGKIIVDDKTYNYDVLINTKGNVMKRSDISITYYSSLHTIRTEEIKQLVEEQKPEFLIIGTGAYGAAKRLEAGIERECKKNNVKLIVAKNPEAAKLFNETTGKKAALFHATC